MRGIFRDNARFGVLPRLAGLIGHRLRAPLLCTTIAGLLPSVEKSLSQICYF